MLSSSVSVWLKYDFINQRLLFRSVSLRDLPLHVHIYIYTYKHTHALNWVVSHDVDKPILWICWSVNNPTSKKSLNIAWIHLLWTFSVVCVCVCVFTCRCLHGQEARQSKRQHQRQCCVASLCQRQRGPWHPCSLPISAGMELSRADSTAAHSKLT